MYQMLATLLIEEFGIEADSVRPEATFRALELDSLSLTELAVIVTERTGRLVDDIDLDTPLHAAAERYATATAGV
ncbi:MULTISPECIES: phosphopantetheine-binding protein [unclassified Streptomyces]|uniref:Phosphopantetheine-binding protein n=1 Tax=Streptomyces millisiae TaxID=3075542 RepID=A0ABU2LWP5_9ACTN|nr:phosphopantetheine-binding protein [Streptomyces sp. DSM 44918]MDT0322029.1 phosphopantetheine-binding protein [Streptomyces sp. DSM 44918]